MNTYFYCSAGDIYEFDTESERDDAVEAEIALYLQDTWDEEVENIFVGIKTGSCQQVNKVERPETIDEEGVCGEGEYWGDFNYKCDYKIIKLEPE